MEDRPATVALQDMEDLAMVDLPATVDLQALVMVVGRAMEGDMEKTTATLVPH